MSGHHVRRRTVLVRLSGLTIAAALLLLACNRDGIVAPPPHDASPEGPTAPAYTVTLEPGSNDFPDGQSGQLGWQNRNYGMQHVGLDIQVAHSTVYRLEASGGLTKRLIPEVLEVVPPIMYGPDGKLAISWTYGSSNNTVTYNGATHILLLAPSRIYQIAQSGLGNENIYGTLTRPDSSSLYCGPQYGNFCYEYVGEPSEYVLTRPNAELTLSVDSGTVTTGSTVRFTIGATPDSVGPFVTPVSVDTVGWIPDPDSSGGDYSEAKVWAACAFSNRQCTRQIVGAGTLRVVAHVNGRRFVGTAHVDTRDKLKLRAVKAYISAGDTVTFTPSMSDGSSFTPYGWSWKADSVTPGQTAVCAWYTSPCRTRVREHGWMTITISKNWVQRKARAHVTIGPRPRLQVDVLSPTIQLGEQASFTTSARDASYEISHWEFNGAAVGGCAGLKSCAVTPIDSGVMWAYGTVEGEADMDSASVRFESDCSEASLARNPVTARRARVSRTVLGDCAAPEPTRPPSLLVSCHPPSVIRGDTVSCVIKLDTAIAFTVTERHAEVGNYVTADTVAKTAIVGVFPIAENTAESRSAGDSVIWSGPIVATTTIRAKAQVIINGQTLAVSASPTLVQVQPRVWARFSLPPQNPPWSYHAGTPLDTTTSTGIIVGPLGGTQRDSFPPGGLGKNTSGINTFAKNTIVGSGPNRDLIYLRERPDSFPESVYVRVTLSPTDSFYRRQDSQFAKTGEPAPSPNPPYTSYCISSDMDFLRDQVLYHEGAVSMLFKDHHSVSLRFYADTNVIERFEALWVPLLDPLDPRPQTERQMLQERARVWFEFERRQLDVDTNPAYRPAAPKCKLRP
jgi:hypothetical protein